MSDWGYETFSAARENSVALFFIVKCLEDGEHQHGGGTDNDSSSSNVKY